MKDTPPALKLADDLVFLTKTERAINVFISKSKLETVAAELRRLHAENEALREMYFNSQFEVGEVRSENEALREALERLISTGLDERTHHEFMSDPSHYARAALARASEAIGEVK